MEDSLPIPDDLYADQLRAGDEGAFRYVMDRYFPIITRFTRRILADAAAAEDVAEETFIKLWQNRAQVGNFSSIQAFLYISAKNACKNELRKEGRHSLRIQAYVADHPGEEEHIDREIIRAEVLAEVYKAIGELPDRMQAVFRLGYLENMPNREIAQVLGISPNTVKAQKARALEILQDKFKGSDLLPFLVLLFQTFGKIKS